MCLGKFIRNWRWLRKATKTFTKPSESSKPFFHRLKKYIYFLETFTTSLKIETHHQKVQSHSSID
jgi:hypothetical protein